MALSSFGRDPFAGSGYKCDRFFIHRIAKTPP
jgi:hypothetical protein